MTEPAHPDPDVGDRVEVIAGMYKGLDAMVYSVVRCGTARFLHLKFFDGRKTDLVDMCSCKLLPEE